MTHWRRYCLAILAVLICGGLFCNTTRAASEDEYYELMKIFVDTFEQIDRNYVTQVDRRELIEAAMRGMIVKLDPYSQYIDNKELKGFNEHVEQEFGGIGIQVRYDDRSNQLYVTMPLPGTPAHKAGVHINDRILEIDDKPVADFPHNREMEMAVSLIKGKPGTVVKLKVMHIGNETPETIDITRATIKSPTVEGDHYDAKSEWVYMIDDKEKIAYVRLSSFGRNSAEEMHDVLVKLTRDGMRGLILDLRFNPGGLLTAATAISDFFVSEGVIVSTKGRNTEEHVVRARKGGTFNGFSMVVLVNRFSASASEIVSACLQDHKRAIIVGERTWGKGSVQNVIELEGGKSAIKLTTASYHRPSGKNIHRFPKATEQDEWGVMPDEGYEVKMTIPEMEAMNKARRERERPSGDSPVPPPADHTDKQLEKAVEAIKKQLAEGKPNGEAAADKPDNVEKKPDEKKPNDTSMVSPTQRRSFVDAILEFWKLRPQQRQYYL